MKSQSLQGLLLGIAASACAVSLTTPAFADNSCDPVYQAAVKSLQTPYHTYSTMTHDAEAMSRSDTFKRLTGKAMYAKTESTESIFDGKATYIQIHGKWARSRASQAHMVDNAREKLKTHPDVCTPAGSQTVGGEAVSVFNIRDAEAGSGPGGQLRVIRSNGLLQGGTQNVGDEVIETRYEYNNVQSPAGVQ